MNKEPESLEEWEKRQIEDRGKSVEERRNDQHLKLRKILTTLNSFYGPAFLSAVRKSEGVSVSEDQESELASVQELDELLDRLSGLKKSFDLAYNGAIRDILGSEETAFIKTVEERREIEKREVDSAQQVKVPRGYIKWDLKKIKLHESQRSEGERIWIEFWSLKGLTGVGEILYNSSKDLFYFRPYDMEKSSTFALTEDQGRKATREARNYYFRQCESPERS